VETVEKRSFVVPSISCGHCTATIKRELEEIDGVITADGDAASKRVAVSWQPPATWEEIRSVLVDISHPPAEDD
jgi:copper chaperone CopZ